MNLVHGKGRLADPWGHHYSPHRAPKAQFIPVSINRVDAILDVWDQGATGSCVAHAILGARGAGMRSAGLLVPNLSRLTLYALAREIDRGPGSFAPLQDVGCMPNSAIRALEQCGTAPYDLRPTSELVVNDEPSLAELEAADEWLTSTAKACLITTYAVPSELSDVKAALANGAFLTAGIAASGDAFERYAGGIIGNQGSQIDHEIMLLDYDGCAVRGLNSWGRSWGEDGMFRLNADGVAGLEGILAHVVRRI